MPDQPFEVIKWPDEGETIAKSRGIRQLRLLKKRFGNGKWLKRKGVGLVKLSNGSERHAELHWYEAHGIGKRLIKIKRLL